MSLRQRIDKQRTIQISVERTGDIFSIAGSGYLATFPDGSTRKIWSPPWNDYSPEEEDANALLYAAQQYVEHVKAKAVSEQHDDTPKQNEKGVIKTINKSWRS